MKITEMNKVDQLDWLATEEEYLLFCLDNEHLQSARAEIMDEIRLVREIKSIVQASEVEDD